MSVFRYLCVRARASALAGCDRGITALEYAMLAAFIALAIIGGATAAGTGINKFYSVIAAHAATTLGTPVVGK